MTYFIVEFEHLDVEEASCLLHNMKDVKMFRQIGLPDVEKIMEEVKNGFKRNE